VIDRVSHEVHQRIVDVREHVSTGYVTKSQTDARVGDRVEARIGY